MSIMQSEVEAPVVTGDLGLSFIDGESAEVIDVVPVTKRVGPLRRAWRVLVRVVARVRVAAARSDVQIFAYARRVRRAWSHTPRHRAERRWFGRQRSTAERNAQRAVASCVAAKEGDLPRHPPEFISWLASVAETLRDEQRALRAPTGRHFICS